MKTIDTQRKNDSTLVTLGENLDIRCAMDFYGDLDKALARKPENIIFDVGSLNSTDTAILQLLVACTLEARRLNKSVSWLNVSDGFRECAQHTGTTEVLGLHSVARK